MATAETPQDIIWNGLHISPHQLTITVAEHDEAAAVDNLSVRLQRVLKRSAAYRRRIANLGKMVDRHYLYGRDRAAERDREYNRAENAINAGRTHKATIKAQRLTIFHLEAEIRGLEHTNEVRSAVIDQQAARIKALENEVEQLKIRVRDDSAIIDSFAAQIKALTGPESELQMQSDDDLILASLPEDHCENCKGSGRCPTCYGVIYFNGCPDCGESGICLACGGSGVKDTADSLAPAIVHSATDNLG